MEMSEQLHVRASLPPRNFLPSSIEYETGWLPELVRTFEKEKKKTRPATGIETRLLGRATPRIVTIGTTLCLLCITM